MEHPKLLAWIKNNKFERITFSGGEPLLYFETIKRYITELGKNITYRIVTNGTIIDDNMVKLFNNYNTIVAVSYDGENSSRDDSLPIKWDILKKLKRLGFSTIFSNPQRSFREISNDINKLGVKDFDSEFVKIGFVHQTKDAPNILFTKKVADKFIEETTSQIEKALVMFVGDPQGYSRVLKSLINPWVRPRDYLCDDEVLCCNRYLYNVGLDGTLFLCPYGGITVGTIDTGVDWNIVKSHIPEKCQRCTYRKSCGCSCVANITNNECYIYQKMFTNVSNLLKTFGFNSIYGIYN